MNFKLLSVSQENLTDYKKDMQEAFQKGAAAEFSDLDTEILPEKEIDSVLSNVNKTLGGDCEWKISKMHLILQLRLLHRLNLMRKPKHIRILLIYFIRL